MGLGRSITLTFVFGMLCSGLALAKDKSNDKGKKGPPPLPDASCPGILVQDAAVPDHYFKAVYNDEHTRLSFYSCTRSADEPPYVSPEKTDQLATQDEWNHESAEIKTGISHCKQVGYNVSYPRDFVNKETYTAPETLVKRFGRAMRKGLEIAIDLAAPQLLALTGVGTDRAEVVDRTSDAVDHLKEKLPNDPDTGDMIFAKAMMQRALFCKNWTFGSSIRASTGVTDPSKVKDEDKQLPLFNFSSAPTGGVETQLAVELGTLIHDNPAAVIVLPKVAQTSTVKMADDPGFKSAPVYDVLPLKDLSDAAGNPLIR